MTDQPTATAVLERPASRPQHPPQIPPRRPVTSPAASPVDRVLALNERCAPVLLRLALAAVFVWFGALKLMGVSPVHDLLGATLPWISADISVPVLGGVEVLLGLAVAAGRLPRITLFVMVGHLCGTFLTFVTASELMWTSNPFQLTADGEFVVKNLVLITAALTLIGWYTRRAGGRAAR